MTLIRNSPTRGFPAAWAISASSSASRRIRLAFSTILSPKAVKRTTRRVRSTRVMPINDSNSRMPADSVDCVTKQASAALSKWPCSFNAAKYCNCFSVGMYLDIYRPLRLNRLYIIALADKSNDRRQTEKRRTERRQEGKECDSTDKTGWSPKH